MHPIAARYRELAERFGAVADAIETSRWGHPSPCAGWTAADVVDHLVTTQRDFLAGRGLALGPAGEVVTDPPAEWRRHLADVTTILDRTGVGDTTFDGYFGPTTVGDTVVRYYGFDMIVHRWDLARAGGVETTFSTDELEALESGIEGFGEHLYMAGICAPAVAVDASASRADRLLGRLGRDPAPVELV